MTLRTLTNPESQPEIDKAEITEWHAEPLNRILRLKLSKGYEDNGKFIIKQTIPVVINGDDYDAAFDAMGSDGMTIRESLLEQIWVYLEAAGIIAVD